MFQVYGIQGRVFSGTPEQLRQQHLVTGVARVRRVAPVVADAGPLTAAHPGGVSSGHARGDEAVQAYGQGAATQVRRPLSHAADVMHRPALTVPAEATLREAWKLLASHGVAQAPVTNADGVLVGMVGRAELMPAASMAPPSAATESARLSQPVTAVMWSPVPCTVPDADLRRVAALLLHTRLPGVPVADDSGEVLGFVSRTDLLRALATDPPLDLWG